MNYILYILAIGMFYALPIILMGVKALRPKMMPWWLAFVFAAGLGWVLANASIFFYYNHAGASTRFGTEFF